jgi:hypothetical protein
MGEDAFKAAHDGDEFRKCAVLSLPRPARRAGRRSDDARQLALRARA